MPVCPVVKCVHPECVADPKLDGITERLEKFLGDISYNKIFANAVSKAGYVFEKSARFTEADKSVEKPKKGKNLS